ncbi:hypothetical protein [Methylocaldum szegediense]|nr:hypothetical protein [Methylocaldum szegediense]
MTELGKPSIVVRVPTPIWLYGMIAVAFWIGEEFGLSTVVQY